MELRAEEISQIIKEQITDYDKKVELSETGVVLSVGDGIARVYGLAEVMALELVEFPGGILGLVLNLEEDNVGCAIMGEDIHIKEGDMVKRTGKIAQVPVGEEVLGRVLSAVGEPLDGKGPIDAKNFSRVEVVAPGVIAPDAVIDGVRKQPNRVVADNTPGREDAPYIGRRHAAHERIADNLRTFVIVGELEIREGKEYNLDEYNEPGNSQDDRPAPGCSSGVTGAVVTTRLHHINSIL